MLGKRKKIAKFLMRTLTYRSTFLYVSTCLSYTQRKGEGDPRPVVDMPEKDENAKITAPVQVPGEPEVSRQVSVRDL